MFETLSNDDHCEMCGTVISKDDDHITNASGTCICLKCASGRKGGGSIPNLSKYSEGPWAVGPFISAARDLLEVIIDLLEIVDAEIEQRQHGGNDEDWLDLKAKSDRGHAVIAKATGGEA